MSEKSMIILCSTCSKSLNRDAENWTTCLRCGNIQCSTCETESRICPSCQKVIQMQARLQKQATENLKEEQKKMKESSSITDEIKQMKFDF